MSSCCIRSRPLVRQGDRDPTPPDLLICRRWVRDVPAAHGSLASAPNAGHLRLGMGVGATYLNDEALAKSRGSRPFCRLLSEKMAFARYPSGGWLLSLSGLVVAGQFPDLPRRGWVASVLSVTDREV